MPIQNQIGLENRYRGAEDIQNTVRRSVCVCMCVCGGVFSEIQQLKNTFFSPGDFYFV